MGWTTITSKSMTHQNDLIHCFQSQRVLLVDLPVRVVRA